MDDSPQNIQLVDSHLKDEEYRISFSQSGYDAIDKVRKNSFDLILMDIMMPGLDGLETCRRIHELPEHHDIPVIFLTAKIDKESIVQGLEAGAVDYIVKPFHGAELLARIRTHLALKTYRERLEAINVDLNKEILRGIEMEEKLRESQQEIVRINRQPYKKATEDSLTGLLNRRKMMDFIEYEYERASRTKKGFSIVLTDIDFFKKVNDTYGHDCGDVVLKGVADTILAQGRKQDQVARWGGEEFLLLLPDTDGRGAYTLAEKIRKKIEKTHHSCSEGQFSVTMTFGVAAFSADLSADGIIKQADMALYSGKNRGRNRSILFGEPLD